MLRDLLDGAAVALALAGIALAFAHMVGFAIRAGQGAKRPDFIPWGHLGIGATLAGAGSSASMF